MPAQTANGFIAKNGTVDFYEWMDTNIIHGLIKVRNNIKYGLASLTGEVVCPCDYDEIVAINDNCFKVRRGERWGAVDNSGKVICPCKYHNLIRLAHGGVYCEMDDDVYYIKL